MKQRHNNTKRKYDLVKKRIQSLSRKSLSVLEDSLLDENEDQVTRMVAAEIMLNLNNSIEEMSNFGSSCSILPNG
jgi:hypothetical protein